MSPASRRWREDDGGAGINGAFPSTSTSYGQANNDMGGWIKRVKLGGMAMMALLCFKFLFYTEPLALEDILPFRNKTMIQFETEHGKFTVELFPDAAPQTVRHFRQLVEVGYYTSDAGFYRSEKGFILQAGGFIHDQKETEVSLPVEYQLPAIERSVVLARQKHPTSGTSEFAIMLTDNTLLNQPSTVDDNPGYTTFGYIYEGWNTVKRIVDKMGHIGFLKKEDKESAVGFKRAVEVQRISPFDETIREVFFTVKNHIETDYSVVIFSKTTCPYCKKAKKILREELGAQVTVVELDLLPNGPVYQDCLEAITGQRTVPNVFVNEKSIGGGDETTALYKSGKLKSMVFASGALAKALILEMINKHPLVVFSKSYCPFCKKAKATLTKLKAKMEVFELDLRQDGKAIQHYLFQLTAQKTVPNVFIGGKSIGGGDDTERLAKSGELKLLLQTAGAL